jgi:stalled ribosome rescue protein Dom34
MSFHFGAAVWIDHHEAKIFHVAEGAFDEATIKAPHHLKRHETVTAEHNHPDDMHHLFAEVARALEGTSKILVLGPSTAKLQFLRYAHEHAKKIEPNIVGVESVDHPTDAQLVSYIKRYFHVTDRVR